VKPGRNEPCPCGSGSKYKKCCGRDQADLPGAQPTRQNHQQTVRNKKAQEETVTVVEMRRLVALFNAACHAELENRTRILVEQYPISGFAWKMLGVSLAAQGKDALSALQKATELLPEDSEAYNSLGNFLRGLGQYEDAVESYRRALHIKADFAAAHNNLGNALRAVGRLDDALESYRRALDIKPDFAAAHSNLGNVLQDMGQLDGAIASFRRALEINPGYAEAYHNAGSALRELGQTDEAVAVCRRALEIKPDYVEAHVSLGNALGEQDQPEGAEASFRRALEIKPDYADAHHNLAIVLRNQRRNDEAEASCRRALEINPDLTAAIALMAELHADKGQFAVAENLFRRAIAIAPEMPEAWVGIARVRKMTSGDAAWLAAAEKIAEGRLPVRKEVYLRYSIGKYHDDVGNFAQAFLNYQRANELTKQYAAQYERQHQTRLVDLLIRLYDHNWLVQKRANLNVSARPVFIVGMPRSGTSLVEQILASHPAVFGAGELSFWKTTFATHEAFILNGGMSDGMLGKLAHEYLRLLERFSTDALHVVDKMPDNFLFLGLIHAAFPNARIIHTQRNPIDTCLSIYFQHFETLHSYANDLDDIAHYYAEYLRVMDHWRLTFSPNVILHVPYEALVADQEGWSRTMLEFIGLPWNARCLNFHESVRTVSTASSWQVRQKISKSSVLRWRNYEKFIDPLQKLME
jgi:tetratricopeptide (TPR) repeat protein